MHIIIKRLKRWLVRAVSVFLPQKQAIALDRWRRGQEEHRKYLMCEYVFASYGKSGRTWMRVMLSRYYQQAYALPERILMGFDNFHKMNADIPRIFFTHDNYLRTYTGNVDRRRRTLACCVVLNTPISRRRRTMRLFHGLPWFTFAG